ncbi:MAG: hypothetical protein H6R07_2862 [Proteobacteria bacterium]|nr:hypothetical protein [Pseudomonadota bacterium]
MSISTSPIRCKKLLIAAAGALLLAACASGPLPSETPGPTPTIRSSEFEAPNVLIRGKIAKVILDSVVKYRTQKGMQIIKRDARGVEFGMPVPKSNPPIEVRMIYSISPAPNGLRLSAQVFRDTKVSGKLQTSEITASLRDNLEEELAGYAR